MKKNENNFAYIDGSNLHNGIKSLGWDFDYARFRVFLREKYSVQKAYIFLGMIPKYKNLYTYLQEAGYSLIFKEVIYSKEGKPKGNCDADIVVKVMQDSYENKFDKALLVSSDGDYASLVSYLLERKHLHTIISPAPEKRCSILLKRTDAKISYIYDQKSKLEARKEKAPNEHRNSSGSFS